MTVKLIFFLYAWLQGSNSQTNFPAEVASNVEKEVHSFMFQLSSQVYKQEGKLEGIVNAQKDCHERINSITNGLITSLSSSKESSIEKIVSNVTEESEIFKLQIENLASDLNLTKEKTHLEIVEIKEKLHNLTEATSELVRLIEK